MTPEQFVYWLQGMIEGGTLKSMSEEQLTEVKKHLSTVFVRITDKHQIDWTKYFQDSIGKHTLFC
jgi:hypothetical protein